jgi:hypothetical protein
MDNSEKYEEIEKRNIDFLVNEAVSTADGTRCGVGGRLHVSGHVQSALAASVRPIGSVS